MKGANNMKIKWGLQIFSIGDFFNREEWEEKIANTEPVFFRTVKDCFEYLGCKLPRAGYGYCGNKYLPAKNMYVEYILMKYPA